MEDLADFVGGSNPPRRSFFEEEDQKMDEDLPDSCFGCRAAEQAEQDLALNETWYSMGEDFEQDSSLLDQTGLDESDLFTVIGSQPLVPESEESAFAECPSQPFRVARPQKRDRTRRVTFRID